MNYYGQLDITKLNALVNNHPEAFKRVTFKDGVEHILLPIDIREKKEEDAHGNAAYIRASIKELKEGVSPYLADLRVSKFQPTEQGAAPVVPPNVPNDAPFTADPFTDNAGKVGLINELFQ